MSKPTPRPTDAELEILHVLWERGPSTVREIHSILSRARPTGYTTVLKFLQIMMEKNLVDRDATQRTHVYRTRASREQTQQQLLRELTTRAYGGSPAKLVMQALSSKRASADELAEIRKLLDALEEEERE